MTKKELEAEVLALSRALVKTTHGDAHMMTDDDWEAVGRASQYVEDATEEEEDEEE